MKLSAGNEMTNMTEQTIVIAATFTAEPIEEAFSYWMQELGIRSRIEFTPCNQVFQQLLDASSTLSRNDDVSGVFTHHPKMLLHLGHFISRRINWKSESENIGPFPEELQLAPNSSIAIDDSPVECTEVRATETKNGICR